MSQPVSEIYADEVIGEDFNGGFPRSDGSISPPPMEMELEEGFALREWRRLDWGTKGPEREVKVEAKKERVRWGERNK